MVVADSAARWAHDVVRVVHTYDTLRKFYPLTFRHVPDLLSPGTVPAADLADGTPPFGIATRSFGTCPSRVLHSHAHARNAMADRLRGNRNANGGTASGEQRTLASGGDGGECGACLGFDIVSLSTAAFAGLPARLILCVAAGCTTCFWFLFSLPLYCVHRPWTPSVVAGMHVTATVSAI